jgi:hypothetical protein
MLFIKGELEYYTRSDRSKRALLQLYLETFKKDQINEIEKKIIDAEDKYYDILEKTIQNIEEGKEDVNIYIEEYKKFLLNMDYLIPLAINFFDINLDLLQKL